MASETSLEPTAVPAGSGIKISQVLDRHKAFLGVLFGLVLVVIYISPFNETSVSDDWAYILTSHHLYDTGEYHLHDWATADLMFQAYWGVLFTLVGGFSIGTLHISTLVLFVIGLFSLYLLALDHGLTRTSAALLSFCLIASPLVLYLAFTFMTDVPALALLTLGLLLYTRGLKRESLPYMFLAGLVTVAATFVRPTSLALLAGLGVLFLLDPARLKRWKLYLAGSITPLIGGLLLLADGTAAKLTGGTVHNSGQVDFITHLDVFVPNILVYRPGLFLVYLGVFSAPLALVVIAGVMAGGPARLKLRPKVLAFFSILIFGFLLYNVFVIRGGWTLPYIGFNFGALELIPPLAWVATLLGLPGGVILGTLMWERVGSFTRWRGLPLEQRFLDIVTLVLLLYTLLFYNLGDRYLFSLLPFSFILIGRYIQPRLANLKYVLIVSGISIIIVTAICTRFFQAEQAAEWKASDYTLALGVAPLKISGPWGWYSSYNYADYLNQNPNIANVKYMFDTWLPQRTKEANYKISSYPDESEQNGWILVKTIPYSDPFFQERVVYLFKRGPSVGLS